MMINILNTSNTNTKTKTNTKYLFLLSNKYIKYITNMNSRNKNKKTHKSKLQKSIINHYGGDGVVENYLPPSAKIIAARKRMAMGTPLFMKTQMKQNNQTKKSLLRLQINLTQLNKSQLDSIQTLVNQYLEINKNK